MEEPFYKRLMPGKRFPFAGLPWNGKKPRLLPWMPWDVSRTIVMYVTRDVNHAWCNVCRRVCKAWLACFDRINVYGESRNNCVRYAVVNSDVPLIVFLVSDMGWDLPHDCFRLAATCDPSMDKIRACAKHSKSNIVNDAFWRYVNSQKDLDFLRTHMHRYTQPDHDLIQRVSDCCLASWPEGMYAWIHEMQCVQKEDGMRACMCLVPYVDERGETGVTVATARHKDADPRAGETNLLALFIEYGDLCAGDADMCRTLFNPCIKGKHAPCALPVTLARLLWKYGNDEMFAHLDPVLRSIIETWVPFSRTLLAMHHTHLDCGSSKDLFMLLVRANTDKMLEERIPTTTADDIDEPADASQVKDNGRKMGDDDDSHGDLYDEDSDGPVPRICYDGSALQYCVDDSTDPVESDDDGSDS